jgi:type IV secretion system protein VirB8
LFLQSNLQIIDKKNLKFRLFKATMKFIELIKSILKKGQEAKESEKMDWQQQRYESISTQRNLFLLFALIMLLGISVAILAMLHVIDSKKISPFVIKIDNSTGATNIVNPLTSNVLSGEDGLARYFIKKYISARETYNPVDFETTARKYIKLTSADRIYSSYYNFISNKDNNPKIYYGTNNTTYIKTKSWSKIDKNKHVCRFSIHETLGDMKVYNKIAIVEIEYVAMQLSDSDQDINPVGFQVKNYRVDDDNS